MKYLLLGLGASNTAIAEDLINRALPFDIFLESGTVPEYIRKEKPRVYWDIDHIDFTKYKFAMKSPGIPIEHPIMEICKNHGIKISNEIDYASKYVRKPVIAITGTNGKTTTTKIVEHILNQEKNISKAVGNIGESFLKGAKDGESVLVTELSSFQLRDLNDFDPAVSIWLNATEAHLDSHPDFDDYIKAKKNVYRNQTETNLMIFNLDDVLVVKEARSRFGYKKNFSLLYENADAYFDGDCIWLGSEMLVHKDDIQLKGLHNIQNIMAASLAATEFVSNELIAQGIKTFKGFENRMEIIYDNGRNKVYNDSKSTNPASVKAALSMFEEPIVLMMGGKDNGNDFGVLNGHWDKVKSLVCFGESGLRIKDEASNCSDVSYAETLAEAIVIAKMKLGLTDTLLFSPGCSSLDEFKNYEERGNRFKKEFEFEEGLKTGTQ